jgi:hypothetical protein
MAASASRWPAISAMSASNRHALMTMIAYAVLQSRRLKAAVRKTKKRRTTAATDHAGNSKRDPQSQRAAPV